MVRNYPSWINNYLANCPLTLDKVGTSKAELLLRAFNRLVYYLRVVSHSSRTLQTAKMERHPSISDFKNAKC